MKYTIAGLLALAVSSPALAALPDRTIHRHTPQELKRIHKANPKCNTWKCVYRVRRAHERKLWRYFRSHQLPWCTWGGESGRNGGPFALFRYYVMNSEGSGARGKYQMMSGTYHKYASRHNWAPIDQEIAGHRLYAAAGTSPWQAC